MTTTLSAVDASRGRQSRARELVVAMALWCFGALLCVISERIAGHFLFNDPCVHLADIVRAAIFGPTTDVPEWPGTLTLLLAAALTIILVPVRQFPVQVSLAALSGLFTAFFVWYVVPGMLGVLLGSGCFFDGESVSDGMIMTLGLACASLAACLRHCAGIGRRSGAT